MVARKPAANATPNDAPSPQDARTAHDLIDNARTQPSGSSKNAGRMPGLSATHAAVAHVVVDAHGYADGWCYLGIARMALRLKMSMSTVRQALADLTAKGWLATKVDVLPSVSVAVTHYRLTPVLTDIMTTDEIDGILAKIRKDTAARVAKCTKTSRATPATDARLAPTAGEVYRPAGAEYPDPDKPIATRTALSPQSSPLTSGHTVVVGGITLQMPLHVGDANLLGVTCIHGVLAHLLPAIASHATAYALAILSSEYNLTPEELIDGMRRAKAKYGDETSPSELQREVIHGYRLTARRSKAAAKLIRERGYSPL